MLDITNKEDYLNGSVHKNLIIELEDGSTISNKNILKESMALDEILMEDNQLHFGRCNASEFSITLATVAANIKNEKIKVYIESNDSRLQLGEFTVNFVEKSADKSFKQITALDNMQNIDRDVTDWYKTLSFPTTQKAFRDSFFSYVGIEQVDVALPFDDLTVNDPFGNMVSINGRIIAEGICELNARFGHCNREGKFEYIQLNTSGNEILDINKKYINCSYDDFVTQTIDRVIIIDEYGTQVSNNNNGNNAYVINNNFMLYGRTVDELRTLGNQFLELVKDVEYTPFTMENRGLPYVRLGDVIHATTNNGEFNSFIFRRTLRGIQALRDTYSAEGEEYLISDLNSIQQKIDEANRNTERTRVELTTSIEGLKSTVTLVETVANKANTKADGLAKELAINYSTTEKTESLIKQSADEITSKVSSEYTTKAEFEKLDVVGVNLILNSKTLIYRDYSFGSIYPLLVDENGAYVVDELGNRLI